MSQECDLSKLLVHPRFVVEKVKADASLAYRPVDHMSWSAARRRKKEASVNGHICPAERISHDHLDDLGQVGRAGVLHSGLYLISLSARGNDEVRRSHGRTPRLVENRY